jgi:hypothetical protein
MAKAQLYMLRLGYQELGVGTINQVQAAQKALEALQLVDRHYYDDSEGERQRVLLQASDSEATTVSRFTGEVMTQEQFRRESIKKIGHRSTK